MKRQSETTRYYFSHEGGNLPIVIRKHAKSRRMVIRYQLLTNSLTLTLPRYVSLKQGLSFIEEKRAWVVRQMAEKPLPSVMKDGGFISLLGVSYTIIHKPGRGLVHVDTDKIIVPGEPEFLKRRLGEWLKKQARLELSNFAQAQAKRIGKSIKKISVRDTSSHWGSCNQSGNLSFSWRLILAPREVLEYVVAHEVAHLVHLNHSEAFWQQVEALYPHYETSRDWLKKNGAKLHQYY